MLKKEVECWVWVMVNKESGGGNKLGLGCGKKDIKVFL